ncbi:hypothetical protein Tco_1012103 [Tanacetum coccineum]
MSLHGYSNDEYENYVHSDNDIVTLISKLDVSHPLHLHPNDYVALTIEFVKLKGTDYQVSNVDEVLGRQWDRVNAVVLDGYVTFNMHHKINSLRQNGSTIVDYYHSLNALWKQLDALVDSGTSERSQSSVFNSNMGNRSNAQRPQTSGTFARPPNVTRPCNFGNIRSNGGSVLVCEHCGFNGHTIDRCFKIIGNPVDFGKKNSSNNNNNQVMLLEREYMPIWLDLREMKFLKQKDGLYYFDENQVMAALKNDIVFENTNGDKFYKICQKAKKTR